MKRPIIAGNWKMNNTNATTKKLLAEIAPLVADAKCEVVVCVPYTNIDTARKAIRGTKIKLGAQNVAWAPKGAYTGEISAEMLKELKVEYVIIGHSERRQYFGETDQSVNARVKAALEAGLKPIICVGETLEEREAGKTAEVVIRQTNGAFEGIDKAYLKRIVVAYEPVWAIGTGVTASAEDAQSAHAFIRGVIADTFGAEAADKVRLQYGGSVKPGNAAELMSQPDIDGALVGGAALKADSFAAIIKASV